MYVGMESSLEEKLISVARKAAPTVEKAHQKTPLRVMGWRDPFMLKHLRGMYEESFLRFPELPEPTRIEQVGCLYALLGLEAALRAGRRQ
jgi:hypothetical protein